MTLAIKPHRIGLIGGDLPRPAAEVRIGLHPSPFIAPALEQVERQFEASIADPDPGADELGFVAEEDAVGLVIEVGQPAAMNLAPSLLQCIPEKRGDRLLGTMLDQEIAIGTITAGMGHDLFNSLLKNPRHSECI